MPFNTPKAHLRRSTAPEKQDDFSLDGQGGRREQYGYRRSLRMWRNGEAYGRLDPDELASLSEPPPPYQAALEDVFGEWAKDGEGGERIKLRVHPHMHRWALYEREYNPELGQELWRCFYIFQTDPQGGYLPPDLDGDPYLAHFRGKVGDYVEPTRDHFEMLEKFNIHKYGYEAVNEHAGEMERRADKEKDYQTEQMIGAFLDEHWHLAHDEINQIQGSGSYMRDSHCRNWTYKSNASRWRRIEKTGYVVIEKKTPEEYYAEIEAELQRFKAAWTEAVGMRANYVPTEEEWAMILEKANVKPDSKVLDATKDLIERRKYYRSLLAKQLNNDVVEEFVARAPSDEEREERIKALNHIKSTRKNAT